MKIKNIAAICKKSKTVVLLNKEIEDGGTVEQYIGDDVALYSAAGLPLLDEDSILTMFDVPEKQHDDYTLQTLHGSNNINFDDVDADESLVERAPVSITYMGRNLRPLYTSSGLVFIDSKYLSPMYDVFDTLELYERQMPSGKIYIVAKAGLLLQAVIMPVNVITETLVDIMRELTEQCSLSLKHSQLKAAGEKSEETEQTSFSVDPETGELINSMEEEN